MSLKSLLAVLGLSLAVTALIFGQQGQQEKVDLNVIHKIKTAELGGGGGFGGGGGRGRGGAGSKVMDIMWSLTDRYGPRLTNSPQFRAAGDWAVGQMKEWGLANVHLEKFATQPSPAEAAAADRDAANADAGGGGAGGGRGGARRAAIPS